MRAAIYVALLVACIAAAPEFTRAVLASAAAVLFEMLPYAAATAVLAPILGRFAGTVLAYAGCGCSSGPGARSIPAALACAMVFGPHVALARWLTAIGVAAVRASPSAHEHRSAPLVHELATLAPAALFAGVLTVAAPSLAIGQRTPALQVVAGVLLGFFAAPCALGGIALASSLHAQSALATSAMLCVAGIVDVRVWWKSHASHARPDRTTYALLALACGIVAFQHGATLVHPRMTLPLCCCAAVCAILAFRRNIAAARLPRVIAAALVIVALLGSPPPPLVATEATLDTLYPGERVEFTGAYEPRAGRAQVVRYAITCCRADARPVGVELANAPAISISPGMWISVRGVVQRRGDQLMLVAERITRVAPPADPFVYL